MPKRKFYSEPDTPTGYREGSFDRAFFHRDDRRRRSDKDEPIDGDEYEAPNDWGHGTEARRLNDGFEMLGASDA